MQKSPRIKKLSSVQVPKPGTSLSLGDKVSFTLSVQEEARIDSILIHADGETIYQGAQYQNVVLDYSPLKTGRFSYDITVHLSGDKTEKKRSSVIYKSNIKPEEYTYRTINQFAHDDAAFTQGLLIYNDQLYESTGQNGKSSLRKVDLMTGKVSKIRNLDNEYFGEGIGIIDDKVYMLTYHAEKCFTFDLNTFDPIDEYYYSGEGWGLTVKEDTLIKSNGSEVLTFHEPNSFAEVRRIFVYDQNGPIDKLNELEYIDGKIYANRWFTDDIYIINPDSGIVEGVINLEGLLPEDQVKPNTNVLNGIAHDVLRNKMYVTGKNWSRMYEIELVKEQNNI